MLHRFASRVQSETGHLRNQDFYFTFAIDTFYISSKQRTFELAPRVDSSYRVTLRPALSQSRTGSDRRPYRDVGPVWKVLTGRK
jgi:hypothetical protein